MEKGKRQRTKEKGKREKEKGELVWSQQSGVSVQMIKK
jgi:hypothetical protein